MEHHPYEQHEGDDIKKLEAELDGADGSFKNEHHKRSKAAMEHSDEQHEEDGSKKVEAAELDGADRSLTNEHQIQSKVWDEFEPIFLNDKVQFAECLSCHFLFSCNGDSCLHRHQETCPAKPEAAERPQVDSEVPSLKKQKTSSMNIANDMSASKFGQESCYQDVARMIILHGYPLSIVEHEEMGRIFKSLNPVANTVSRSDMEEHLLDLFQKEMMSLRDKIALTSRCVSLSASIWTDDGPEPTVKYLCLTAHFIDEDWRIHRRIIKFGMYWCSPTNLERTIHCKEARVPDSESGPYNVIWDAIRDWNLDHKILSLTSVGEIKNDANTAKLKAMLMEKRCLPIRGKLCNIACLDDMINNVVAEGQSDILVLIGDTVMDFFVAHASSPLAQQQLLEAISQMSLKCPLEDAKWWHKFYFRLEVLLQFKKLYPAEEVLSPEDMRVTESIGKILRTFYRAIEVISGPSPPTSNIYFGEVWKVRTVLQEEASNENVEIATLVMVLQHAFNEYWQNSYVWLSIPVVLDPRFKMSFIKFRLRRAYGAGSASYLSEIRDTVQELFSEYYKPMNQLNGAVVSSSADDKDSLEDWDEHVSSQILRSLQSLMTTLGRA